MKLAILITVESIFGLIFQFLFMYGSSANLLQLFIISFMVGGNINVKGYSLTLFTFRYLSSSLEAPEQTLLSNGKSTMRLPNLDLAR